MGVGWAMTTTATPTMMIRSTAISMTIIKMMLAKLAKMRMKTMMVRTAVHVLWMTAVMKMMLMLIVMTKVS